MTDPDVPMRQRTSWLAGLGFWCGLASALTVAAGAIVVFSAESGDLLGISMEERRLLFLAARVALFCSLAPAVGATAFWLAGRSVVRDAQGGLRGVGLYRAGLLMALLSVWAAFGGSGMPAGMAEAGLRRTSEKALAEEAAAPLFTARAFVVYANEVPALGPETNATVPERLKLPRELLGDWGLLERVAQRMRKEFPGSTPSAGGIHRLIKIAFEARPMDIHKLELFRVEARGATSNEAAALANLFAEVWVEHSLEELKALVGERVRALKEDPSAAEDLEKCRVFLKNPSARVKIHQKAAVEPAEKP